MSKVDIKKFQVAEITYRPNTIHFSCDIKLSPEYFQSLMWDSRDNKNMQENAEYLGEMVKNEIIKYALNQNKDGKN